MTIQDTLKASGIDRLDAEMLLAGVLMKNRAWLLAHSDECLSREHEKKFQEYVSRRNKKEPLAYILGYKEFYGRRFIVSPDVLIPRPSTEGLTECALQFLRTPTDEVRSVDSDIVVVSKKLRDIEPELIVDIGTGSGCIAITLALEGVKQPIVGIDTSLAALKIAGENAKRLGSNVSFIESGGIEYVRSLDRPFLLVSNPPYIPEGTKLPPDVSKFEPYEALFAGEDGMDVLRPLQEAASANPCCVGFVMECRKDQVAVLP